MAKNDVKPKEITIELARAEDDDAAWEIFRRVVATGDTYTYKPDTSREEANAIWTHDPRTRYIVRYNGVIAAFYDLKPNNRGLGSHIANAGYMVHPDFQGLGIGKAMGYHSFKEAKKKGFLAMQFNMVVSTNERAVRTWKSIGFEVIGTIPKAFRHSRHGLVDAYIMYRSLDDISL
jgi:ribosomal protein S18 acetylase RimI-like enzyme